MSILQKIIMGRKRIKSNQYQLNLDLTRSIWLKEDDPKSNWLNSVLVNQVVKSKDQLRITSNTEYKSKVING